ncbi:MAG: hypothetical protein LBS19_13095, partial [Clostridiales bacterium]|nr:hypothetical protein [Clostridiales bacterium]
MSRRGLKARGKVTQKMSKDGLFETNAATGENKRLSKREAGLDLGANKVKGGSQASSQTYSQVGTRYGDIPGNRKKNLRGRGRPDEKDVDNKPIKPPLTPEHEPAINAYDAPEQFAGAFDVSHNFSDTEDIKPSITTPTRSGSGKLKARHGNVALKQEAGAPLLQHEPLVLDSSLRYGADGDTYSQVGTKPEDANRASEPALLRHEPIERPQSGRTPALPLDTAKKPGGGKFRAERNTALRHGEPA